MQDTYYYRKKSCVGLAPLNKIRKLHFKLDNQIDLEFLNYLLNPNGTTLMWNLEGTNLRDYTGHIFL